MKKLFQILLCIFPFVTGYAQQARQIQEDVLITGPFTDFGGKMNYSYFVNDYGEKTKDGALNISGSQKETYGNIDITGSYKLSASCKKGDLDGKMTISAKYHGVKHTIRGDIFEDYAYSLSGNFSNGYPHGAFSASATNFGKVNVSYKNGTLVGAFSVDVMVENDIATIKGTLDDSGKMIGTWNFSILGTQSTMEFINGIRIRHATQSEETPDSQMKLAKQFAQGSISETQLKEMNISVLTDSLKIGQYAEDIYTLKVMADWMNLGGCDFKKSYWVKYKYLYTVLPISEKLFSGLLSQFEDSGEGRISSSNYHFDERIGKYIVSITDWDKNAIVTRSLSEEQANKINSAIEEHLRKKAHSSIEDFIRHASNGHLSGIRLPFYNNEVRKANEALKANIPAAKAHEILKSSWKYIALVKALNLENYPKTDDGLYYIFDSYNNEHQYLSSEAVSEFNSLYKQIEEAIPMFEVKAKEEAEARKAAILAEKRRAQEEAYRAHQAELTQIVSSVLDQVVGKKMKEFSGSERNREMFFGEANNSTVREDDFKKKMGPYLPLQSYTIEQMEESGKFINCTCLWDISKGKNKIDRYRVHFTIQINKLRGDVILLNSVSNIKEAEHIGVVNK